MKTKRRIKCDERCMCWQRPCVCAPCGVCGGAYRGCEECNPAPPDKEQP